MSLGGDIIQEANQRGVVLTRLHARYTKDDLEEDLIFKKADPIVGGRGTPSGENPKMAEEGSKPGSYNNFQGRYIMLNYWEGKIECENPQRGVWGGPPNGGQQTRAASDIAFAPRGKFELPEAFAQEKIPGLKLEGSKPEPRKTEAKAEGDKPAAKAEQKTAEKKQKKKSNCASAGTPDVPASPLALLLLGLIGLMRRRARD
jgi:MYXO-CTERM domain-containing protein